MGNSLYGSTDFLPNGLQNPWRNIYQSGNDPMFDMVGWGAIGKSILTGALRGVGTRGVARGATIGDNIVYHSVENCATRYVGITNNLARRQAEHLASRGINIQPLMKNLTRSDARAVEQALIEIHGLEKNGGSLINKINSISSKNPIYGQQLKRGYDLLKTIGYE